MVIENTKEVQNITNEQTHILLDAIKIIAEKSETKEEFLKIKKPQ